ncbi:MAG: hypothetical protein HOH74_03590 [Gemmatimonadetes bacterium]|nr:hypothetical protein [Gemmatimonadota bacterium]
MTKATMGLTVEAWLQVDESRAEAVQTAVADWRFADQMTGFTTYDAGTTDGLPTQGFFGAVYSGGHVYFSPQCNNGGRHGMALRHTTTGGFDRPDAWQAVNVEQIDGLVTRGYYGCVADGRYVYYVPRTDGQQMHSRVLRYDSSAAFTDTTSWSAFDVGEPISHQGGAFDGRFVYFAPGYHQVDGRSGQVLRYDTTAHFTDSDSWERFDAALQVGDRCRCYDGAVFDGRHVYFVPLDGGDILRYDVNGAFGDQDAWDAFDPRDLFAGQESGACVGAIFDGRYVYFTPYAHGTVVRYDTALPFEGHDSWSTYEAATTSSLDCRGYDGAAFDGRYVYFIPFWEGDDAAYGFHARLLRYDTLRPFEDDDAWQAADGSALAPPNPGGFNGGAFDGRHLYLAPWRQNEASGDIQAHGHVLRYDSAAPGARFQLRWMDCGHNGGLGGSVPGPAFIVNPRAGAVSVQAHEVPRGGRHHLAGVVVDERVELWLDGACVASQSLPAPICEASQESLSIGELAGGASPLLGRVMKHRVTEGVQSPAWLEAAPGLLEDPAALGDLRG